MVLMAEASNSSLSAFCSSMARVMPMIKGMGAVAQLNAAMCRDRASHSLVLLSL